MFYYVPLALVSQRKEGIDQLFFVYIRSFSKRQMSFFSFLFIPHVRYKMLSTWHVKALEGVLDRIASVECIFVMNL